MSDVILLRTLTLKSKLMFGKYSDLTVQEVVNINQMSYLRWAYYNMDGITFIPKILIALGINQTGYINKPGTDKNIWSNITKYKKLYKGLEGHILMLHNKKRSKQRIQAQIKQDTSLASLQRYNHGHR